MTDKIKILLPDKLSQAGIDWLEAQDDVDVTVVNDLSPEELGAIVGQYDGMIIRSGVKAKGVVMENIGRLKGIARAGVGVDNIDIPLCTEKGVIVMNTPDGNTVSTAELAFALMIGLSRNLASANASMREGKWDRKKFTGAQLAGKTLGVIGMGRIGRTMAKLALGFDMRVIGYDPMIAGPVMDGVEHVKDVNEMCKRADYITVHVPKTAETTGMIGAEQLELMKPTARVINAARGGVIDPVALLDALNNDKIAGAGLDVYLSEPPDTEAEKALVLHEKTLCVPHLGASTKEAQVQVGLDAAQQLVEALRGGEVKNAINAPGFGEAIPEMLKPYAELAPRMGALLAGIAPGAVSKIEVIYRGEIADLNVAPITTYLLVGLMQNAVDMPVNVINAPGLAKQRGLEVQTVTSDKAREFANLMEVKIETENGPRSAIGTIFGNKYPRVIAIDNYPMEMRPEGHCVVLLNDDAPGVMGHYGTVFGKHEVNIADLTLSRKKRTGMAMVGVNIDQPADEALLKELRELPGVQSVWYVNLPELPGVPSDE